MPKITLTWNQVNHLTDILEGECEGLRKYPCDDISQLQKCQRLRQKFYNLQDEERKD